MISIKYYFIPSERWGKEPSMANQKIQKIEKMVVKSFEELENLAAEKGLIISNTDNENIFNLKTSEKAKTVKMEVEVQEEEVQKQVHIPRDRDIKIESGKVGDIGVKLIYHRMKDGEKQFRIFLSQKIDGKLKRVRLVNDEIKSIEKDEKKMIEYLHKILNKEIKIKVA